MAIWEKLKTFARKRIDFQYLGQEQYQVRLVVAIPLILSVLVFGYGIMYLGVFRAFVASGTSSIGAEELFDLIGLLKQQMIWSVSIAFLVGLFLAYAIILPLKEIKISAETVSAGDLTARVRVNQDDEIGQLGRAFNEMIFSLNRHFLDSMTGGVLTIDRGQRIIAMNTTAELSLGYQSGQVVGRRVADLFPEHLNTRLYELISGAVSNRRGEELSEQLELITKTGRRIDVSMSMALLRAQNDNVLGMVVNFRDVEQFRAELDRSQTIARLTSLGTMAAGLAHELRNPLGSVKGLVELIREELDEGDRTQTYAKTIAHEIARLEKSIQGILDFAQSGQLAIERSDADVNRLLDETLTLAEYDPKHSHIQVERHYAEQLPLISVDGSRLQQAFLNIILNAFTVLQAGGTLQIVTKLDPDTHDMHIMFQDDGPGIKPEVVNQMFDPFFTTRAEGTGLGLSIAHQVVTAHHGRIEVESVPGAGATLSIVLPTDGQMQELGS